MTWFAGGVVLALAGCTSSDPDDETGLDTGETGETGEKGCFASPAEVLIGTGESTWEALNPGDPVIMVHGPQGGWHMLGSALVRNTGQVVSIHYTITDETSGVLISDHNFTVALNMVEECAGVFPGMFAILEVSQLASGELDTPPELLAYQPVRMRMEVDDQEGHTAAAELVVTAQPDPADEDLVEQ